MYAEMSVKTYLRETGSAAPVPGGGSVAALSAALAAALTRMVAGLTVGRKKFAAVEEDMQRAAAAASALLAQCKQYIDADPIAYGQVMRAFKLPRDTAEEKETRSAAVQEAFKQASRVPLEIARSVVQVMELTGEVITKGNPNAATDGAVAVLMARAAGLGALYNVRTNLSAIKDGAFVERLTAEVEQLERTIVAREKELLEWIRP